MRLERAALLLEQRAGTISEVAYAVGFRDAEYFSRLFRQAYGIPPSAYRDDPSAVGTQEMAEAICEKIHEFRGE